MDFLAAIARDPTDLALRAVWADALQQGGDPRGEFVAIQLAPRTRATWARERALVAEHGAAWAGTLGPWFTEHAYEGGICVGGAPVHAVDPVAAAAAITGDPMWPLVTTLRGRNAPRLWDTPNLRRLLDQREEDVERFLADPDPHPLVELGVLQYRPELGAALRSCARLPALATLAIFDNHNDLAGALATAPVIERVRCLRVEITELEARRGIDGLLRSLGARAGLLRTVELALVPGGPKRKSHGWLVRFERDVAPGPFSRLVAWHEGDRPASRLVRDCSQLLGIVCGAEIHDVAIDIGRPLRSPPAAIPELVAQLANTPALVRVQVPWEVASTPEATTRWAGGFHGMGLFDAMPAILAAFRDDLGVALDAYTIDERGTPALGKTPMTKLAPRLADPKTSSVALRRRGSTDHVTVKRYPTAGFGSFSVGTARSPGELEPWFARMLAAIDPEVAALHLESQRYWFRSGTEPFSLECYARVPPGWLVALPRALAPHVTSPVARGALAEHAPAVRAIEAPSGHAVFAIGAAPDAATQELVDATAAVLVDILDAAFAPSAPAWFPRLVRTHFGDVVCGMPFATASALRFMWRERDERVIVRLVPGVRGGWDLHAWVTASPVQTFVREEAVDEQRAAVALAKAAAEAARHR